MSSIKFVRLFIFLVSCGLCFYSCSREDLQPDLLNNILLSGCDEDTGLPIADILRVVSEDEESILFSGRIIEECGSDVSEYGICYSTTPSPTVDNKKIVVGGGSGEFSVTINELETFQSYHAKAYAVNSSGVAYGPELMFGLTVPIRELGPAGGIIFYDKGFYSEDWRYLEAAPASTDWEPVAWGCSGTTIGTAVEIGAGKPNTDAFISVCSDPSVAANLCASLEHNGYDDWFFPSLYELNTMFFNLHIYGKGGFVNTSYWSSSELNSFTAQGTMFSSGVEGTGSKNNVNRVRAARRF